jgi:hypothetical protein
MTSLTRAHHTAHVLRVEVVLVPITATIHELLTPVLLRVEVPAWDVSLALPNFHGFKTNISCIQKEK